MDDRIAALEGGEERADNPSGRPPASPGRAPALVVGAAQSGTLRSMATTEWPPLGEQGHDLGAEPARRARHRDAHEPAPPPVNENRLRGHQSPTVPSSSRVTGRYGALVGELALPGLRRCRRRGRGYHPVAGTRPPATTGAGTISWVGSRVLPVFLNGGVVGGNAKVERRPPSLWAKGRPLHGNRPSRGAVPA